MNSLTIGNLDEHLEMLLSLQAARHGCSPEQEALHILRSVLETQSVGFGFAQKIAQRFTGLDTTELVSPMRGVVKLPIPPEAAS